MNGCAALDQGDDQAIVRGAIDTKRIAQGKLEPELEYLHEFALMSAEVYEKDVPIEKICSSVAPFRWTKIENLNEVDFPPRRQNRTRGLKIKGFQYSVWERKPLGEPPTIAIAFRGTDPKQLGDWFSNFRWVTRAVPLTWDQYDQTRDLIPKLIEEIRGRDGYKDARIVATGHSLGGGLAQQAGYMSDQIDIVYAFDSSVVTGFFSVDYDNRIKSQTGMRIYRVYERGEVLAILRWAMKKVFPIAISNPKIVEIRYNLKRANAIAEHSMRDLACSLEDVFDKRNQTS